MKDEEILPLRVRQKMLSFVGSIMLFCNTIFTCMLIAKRWHQILLCLLTFISSFYGFFLNLDPESFKYSRAKFYIIFNTTNTFVMLVCFLKFSLEIDSIRMQYLTEQYQENNLFKRVINQVEEAMIIILKGKVAFTNRVA